MKPRHWSFSSLSLFEQCPHRWWLKYHEKLADPRSPALDRGIKVHEILEHAMRAPASRALPAKRLGAGKWLDKKVEEYRSREGLRVEQAVHLDKKWNHVPPHAQSYIPPGTWVTGKLDVLAIGFVSDWKTGKVYTDKHEDQMHLYVTMLASLTGILRWDCELVYVDQDHVDSFTIVFDDPEGETLEAAQKSWRERADKIKAEREFPKQPSPLCNWCPYHHSKGGPCDGKRD